MCRLREASFAAVASIVLAASSALAQSAGPALRIVEAGSGSSEITVGVGEWFDVDVILDADSGSVAGLNVFLGYDRGTLEWVATHPPVRTSAVSQGGGGGGSISSYSIDYESVREEMVGYGYLNCGLNISNHTVLDDRATALQPGSVRRFRLRAVDVPASRSITVAPAGTSFDAPTPLKRGLTGYFGPRDANLVRPFVEETPLQITVTPGPVPTSVPFEQGLGRIAIRRASTGENVLSANVGDILNLEVFADVGEEEVHRVYAFLELNPDELQFLPVDEEDNGRLVLKPFQHGDWFKGEYPGIDNGQTVDGFSATADLQASTAYFSEGHVGRALTGSNFDHTTSGSGVLARFAVRVVGVPASGTATVVMPTYTSLGSRGTGYLKPENIGILNGFAEVVPLTVNVVSGEGETTAESADFDGSGTVDFADFTAFAGGFGSSRLLRYDLDGNGAVDFGDFVRFAQLFGETM